MRFLLGWGVKLGLLAIAYLALTGGLSLKLPQTVLGYEMPHEMHQWAARVGSVEEMGDKAQAGVRVLADRIR